MTAFDASLRAAREHHAAGRLAEAEAAYSSLVAQDAASVRAACGLAMILCRQGRKLAEAETLLHATAKLNPSSTQVRATLAAVVGAMGRHGEAATLLRGVVTTTPNNASAWGNLGVALEHSRKTEEAVEAYQQALAISPGVADTHNNLGNALRSLGRLGEAEAEHREAIRLQPTCWRAWKNLAHLMGAMARADEAVECHRRVVELRPTDPAAGSDLLLAMHHCEGIAAKDISEAHLAWARRCAAGREAVSEGRAVHLPVAPLSVRFPGQRLRVGYVSPDFREYPAARFFGGILRHHDRRTFEIFCYSDVARPDAVTGSLRAIGHAWRDTARLTDEQAAQLIRQDGIDILVDLAGHMNNPRLTMFARRVAPVQVTYLGYPNTTGLATMDYRLTDAWHDVPGEADPFHTEKLIRLPRCCWAYTPGEDLPEVGPLPALSRGYVTFAAMNRLVKVTPRMIGLWSRILSALPGSRLMVLGGIGADEPRVRQHFHRHGLDPARLDLVGLLPRREYLARFAEADIALDTFPYAGMTTTCDGLWMGVPTVTLAGETHVSRTGVSILTAAGLPELIAASADTYVAAAIGLARNTSRLAATRESLRARVEGSPLADHAGITRAVEAAYRQMLSGTRASFGR